MTTNDWIQLVVLILALSSFYFARSKDRKQDSIDRVNRSQREQSEHQRTRNDIKDLTHALELRVQGTERDVARFHGTIEKHGVSISNLEKDVIKLQALVR